jgi:deoxyribodipyrimidine photo-lyase
VTNSPIIVWLRHDLRLSDNEALVGAASSKRPVVPLYILDEEAAGAWTRGAASRWWLHHSLVSMGQALEGLGSRLVLRRGASAAVLDAVIAEIGASAVHIGQRYEPWAQRQDAEIAATMAARGISVTVSGGALMHDPQGVRTQQGDPYKVFTPFWRKLQEMGGPPQPVRAPRSLVAPKTWPRSEAVESFELLPRSPDWAGGLRATWTPGEQGARARLKHFLAGPVDAYGAARDFPDREGTSRLSPYLHFGEISARACWHAALAAGERRRAARAGVAAFRRELGWREFSHHLLVHWPQLPDAPFRPEFAAFPWERDGEALRRWQRGLTGYPIVDAGMRQLWHTGWMHNRVRMIVASFLVKDLRIGWRDGEAWFWDTLVDADLANNAASWQWVAGSGADAAPYFRIFNPVKQGETYDPDGSYVRTWVPELKALETRYIHAPWTASEAALAKAGIVLGTTYPRPMVDHGVARRLALAGYEAVTAARESS